MKQDIDAALARLAEAFPQTFVLEKYRPHWPLKVGIAADIPARCPAVERRVLRVALSAYTRRVMYLRGPRRGRGARRPRRQSGRRGDRQGRRICCGQARRDPGIARSQAGRGCGNQGRGAGCKAGGSNGGAAPPAVKVLTLKKRPVLRLPAFRQQRVHPSGRLIGEHSVVLRA